MIEKIKDLFFLHLILLMYSCSSILSKFASQHEFMTIGFVFLYCGVLFLLFLYALLWQQIIKKMDMTVAYSNKAVTVIWGMLWGFLFFKENVSVNKIIGAIIIIVGVFLVVGESETNR